MFEFKFEVDDAQHVVHLKPWAELPIGIAALNEYTDERDQMRDTFKWAATPDDYELLKLMSAKQLDELMKDWQADDGVTMGESSASSTSSKSTGRRSKQTSSPSASD